MSVIAEASRFHIYVLKDPRSQNVLYVGRTKDPKMRLSAHISAATKGNRENTRKNNRLRKLIALDARPVLEIIESGIGDSAEAERRWIAELRSQGIDLLNGTDGGEGVCGPRGPQSPEHVANRRAALGDAYKNPNYRARLSAAVKAAIAAPTPEHSARVAEHLRNLRQRQKDKPVSAETRARISAAHQRLAVIGKRKTATIYHVEHCRRDKTSRENVIRLGYGSESILTVRKDEELVVFTLTRTEFADWHEANSRLKIISSKQLTCL